MIEVVTCEKYKSNCLFDTEGEEIIEEIVVEEEENEEVKSDKDE